MNCPHCDQLIYSRQRRKCDFCGEELPDWCRLTNEEILELHVKLKELAERRAAFKAKEEEEKENKRDYGGGFTGGDFPSGG